MVISSCFFLNLPGTMSWIELYDKNKIQNKLTTEDTE